MDTNGNPLPNPFAMFMDPDTNVQDHLKTLQDALDAHCATNPNSEYHDDICRARCLLATLPHESPWDDIRNRYGQLLRRGEPGRHAWCLNYVGAWNQIAMEVIITQAAQSLTLHVSKLGPFLHEMLGLTAPPNAGIAPLHVFSPPADEVRLHFSPLITGRPIVPNVSSHGEATPTARTAAEEEDPSMDLDQDEVRPQPRQPRENEAGTSTPVTPVNLEWTTLGPIIRHTARKNVRPSQLRRVEGTREQEQEGSNSHV